MRRLWGAVAGILLLLGMALWNAVLLKDFTQSLTDSLQEVEARVEAGDWAGAEALTEEARDAWHSRDLWLHITLRHTDTDEIQISFDEVLRLIRCQARDEYASAAAQLVQHLELMAAGEQLTLENLF